MLIEQIDKGLWLFLNTVREDKGRYAHRHIASEGSYSGEDMTKHIKVYQHLYDFHTTIISYYIIKDNVEATLTEVFSRYAPFIYSYRVIPLLDTRQDYKCAA